MGGGGEIVVFEGFLPPPPEDIVHRYVRLFTPRNFDGLFGTEGKP